MDSLTLFYLNEHAIQFGLIHPKPMDRSRHHMMSKAFIKLLIQVYPSYIKLYIPGFQQSSQVTK